MTLVHSYRERLKSCLHINNPAPLCLSHRQPVGAGLDVFEGRPKLSAWRDRVETAVGKELFDDAHQAILGAQESVKMMDPSKMQLFRPRILKLFM